MTFDTKDSAPAGVAVGEEQRFCTVLLRHFPTWREPRTVNSMAERKYQLRMQRIARREQHQERFWRSWLGRRIEQWLLSKMPPLQPPPGGEAGVREPRRPAPAPPSLRASLDE
jgi:hypothetical protein